MQRRSSVWIIHGQLRGIVGQAAGSRPLLLDGLPLVPLLLSLRRQLLHLGQRLVLPPILHLGHGIAETRSQRGCYLSRLAPRRGRLRLASRLGSCCAGSGVVRRSGYAMRVLHVAGRGPLGAIGGRDGRGDAHGAI